MIFQNLYSNQGKDRHKNALYFVIFLGLAWFTLFTSAEIVFYLYPQNYESLVPLTQESSFVFFNSGQLFGMNMIFLGLGYVSTSKLLQMEIFKPLINEKRSNFKKRKYLRNANCNRI